MNAGIRTRAVSPGSDRVTQVSVERERIEFLLRRDGLSSTLTWVERTMGIYRRALLGKSHHASLPGYRRGFIQSYCEFKRWLTEERERPRS